MVDWDIIKALPQPLLYLAGVIYLYRKNEENQTKCKEEMFAWMERYHALLNEQTKNYVLILRKLEEEDQERRDKQ